ncbi:hypothetical protein PAEPH01_0856 [Pancytospora epiphaga]|nr:hypothetical protein PAEPH01_0856 [Pancytospora epiphaga]
MNSELEKLCNRDEYDKISSLIKSLAFKNGSCKNTTSLPSSVIAYLQKYTEKKFMAYLYNEETVPVQLVNLIATFETEYILELKATATNYIVSQALAKLTQFLALNFTTLESLKNVYKRLEDMIEELNGTYHTLPPDWDLELRLICKAFIIIKQQICDYFFVNEIEEASYVQGLFATVALEKKLQPYLEMKSCCSHQIKFTADEIQTPDKITDVRCIHERMLSSIFISHIEIYFTYILKPYINRKFEQETCDFSIISIFLVFFRDVERIFEAISYFDDSSVFCEFLIQTDFYLCQLVKRLNVADELDAALDVLSTTVYVRETVADLSEKLLQYCTIDFQVEILDAVAEIELLQTRKIEKRLSESFPSTEMIVASSETLCEWFQSTILEKQSVSDEIKGVLLEIGMARALITIGRLKMSQDIAELLLERVCDLEQYLKRHFACIPHINSINRFLKIFACPTDDRERFVENFQVLSTGMFSFSQILSALENQEDAADLFVQYKKNKK